MSDLTAIDVLIDPDDAALQRAREVNARVLQSMPQGWVLDDTHQPHITTLQRYVRTRGPRSGLRRRRADDRGN
jgi:hypothetical protein